jgi:DNA-binding response OmpR family regulator
MKKILIVDDEFEFVNDLAWGLEIFGYQAFKAGDGGGAMSVINKVKPDIVLCDYKLPDMDGDAILKKAKEANPALKFIMITAYYDEELKTRFKNLGADEVIYKPIVLLELEELLKRL